MLVRMSDPEADPAADAGAAGVERRPLSPDRRPVTAAIALSAALHIGIVGLVLHKARLAEGSVSMDAMAVEIVFETPAVPSSAEAMQEAAESAVPPAGPPLIPEVRETTPEVAPPPPKPAPPTRRRATIVAAPSPRPARAQSPEPVAASAPPVSAAADEAATAPDATVPVGLTGADAVGAAATPPSAGTRADTGGQADTATAATRARLLEAYGRLVWARIAAHKPQGLRLAGRTGMSFTIAADGTLMTVRVARSSGNAELDRLALETVQAAAPLPPPPPALGLQPVTFELPFSFR